MERDPSLKTHFGSSKTHHPLKPILDRQKPNNAKSGKSKKHLRLMGKSSSPSYCAKSATPSAGSSNTKPPALKNPCGKPVGNPNPAATGVRKKHHKKRYTNRYTTGTELVHNWYRTGTELVQNWYTTGTELVHNWYTNPPKKREGYVTGGTPCNLTLTLFGTSF